MRLEGNRRERENPPRGTEQRRGRWEREEEERGSLRRIRREQPAPVEGQSTEDDEQALPNCSVQAAVEGGRRRPGKKRRASWADKKGSGWVDRSGEVAGPLSVVCIRLLPTAALLLLLLPTSNFLLTFCHHHKSKQV